MTDELDPLRDSYRRSITEGPQVLDRLHAHSTALLVIDVQYLDAAPGHGVFADAAFSGVPPKAQEYYFDTLRETVLPNIRRLQDAFRRNRLEVIHTRIMSLTPDGRDRSSGHKRLGLHAAPGSKDAEFLPEVAPEPGEIVISKTASGVFTSTNMEYVLRNLGIRALYVTGVYTNECVSTAVRDGSDLGFHMTLVQDACTTVTPELQAATVRVLRDRYARVLRTKAAVAEIERLARDRR
ncbi:cysteine hydrolase family protein [Paraliomyxa miuraensis]|uniref:cysteine hydrolase family protein n=1 Tax=Paraliomyxa miuraensis TaxID=376150 RepID=UPI002250F488|nr:isochorismatase family cysteine hydrolase [Paraliomyxa miuraensis]MCX4240866.1 cysteine hydrolase [Paraliomyxa miuraensis]